MSKRGHRHKSRNMSIRRIRKEGVKIDEIQLEPQIWKKILCAIYGVEGDAPNCAASSFPWVADSEFLMSGRRNAPEDVHTIQVGKGDKAWVIWDAESLKWFLHYRVYYVDDGYAFVALPDVASFEEWLPKGSVRYHKRGSQIWAYVKYGRFKCRVYDAQPLLKSFGLRNLERCGNLLGCPKLAKPGWLGLRAPKDEAEREELRVYAANDIFITSGIVQWMRVKYGADPKRHASAGTLARDHFSLPKRLSPEKGKRVVVLSPIEESVRNACHAGRSEAFWVGVIRRAFYNDVKSLYPVAGIVARALEIVGVVPCDPYDLYIGPNLQEAIQNYGWIEGVFETDNDLWGLPVAGRNKVYMVGKRISGFFNSLDLVASKARIVHAVRAFRPVFHKYGKWKGMHDKAADMLLERLEGGLDDIKNRLYKAVLNSLWGKTGQSKPVIAKTSNFFTYGSMLGCSHAIMSKSFDIALALGGTIYGTDTDSVFSDLDMTGKLFELSDGERCFPVIMDLKGKGDLNFFRSKRYIMVDPEIFSVEDLFHLKEFPKKGLYIARHGWDYPWEDYVKLFNGTISELKTRRDVKHTLMTREGAALEMAKGRWRTKPVTLDLSKLKDLLSADEKRRRRTYDSLQLVMDGKNADSEAWNFDEYWGLVRNPLELALRDFEFDWHGSHKTSSS